MDMRRMMGLGSVVVLLGVLSMESASAQTLQYAPYGSLRGRAVARDGLFRVQKYHWGNGLTPQGASVLNTAIETVVPLIPTFLGREVESDASRSRNASRFAPMSENNAEMERANELYARTQRLLGDSQASVQPQTTSLGDRLSPAEVEQAFGTNPW